MQGLCKGIHTTMLSVAEETHSDWPPQDVESGEHAHDHDHEGHDEGHGHSHGHKHGGEEDSINLRGAIIHVLGDFVQSIGVAIAGALIWWKQVASQPLGKSPM